MSTREGSVRKRHTRTCASRTGGRCRCAGAWQYRVRTPDGGRLEQGGYPTRDAAEAALREVQQEVDRGTYRRIEATAFDAYAARWIDHVRPTLRPSTAASYEQIARTHLTPYFGAMAVNAIAPTHVRAFVADKSSAVRKDGRPVWGPATVRNMLAVLKLTLGAAVEDGVAAFNAAERVKPPKVEEDERVHEPLTEEELARVLAAAGDPWADLFAFLGWTALRRGEALALRWADVDLEQRRVFVRRTRGKFGEGPPKSRAGRRVVPLTPGTVAALRRLRRSHLATDGAEDGGHVFRSRTGGALDPDHVGRAWRRALRKSGVRHVSVHSLRHLGVSRMIASGASIKTVQVAVGHASPMLTLATYGHMLESDLDDLATGLTALAERDPRRDPSGPTTTHFDDLAEVTPIEARRLTASGIPA